MSAGGYMILGAALGVFFCLFVALTGRDFADFSLLLFASGALFGKGYGIWEARSAGDER